MAATEFRIPESWFQGRKWVSRDNVIEVVPNGGECDSDTLLTILSESSMQLQHQGTLDVEKLVVDFEDLTASGIKAIGSMVHAGLLKKLKSLRVYFPGKPHRVHFPRTSFLGADATAAIAEMLQSGNMPPNLRSLSLGGFDFEDKDSANSLKLILQNSLKLILQNGQLHNVVYLNLSWNRLSGNGIKGIFEALDGQGALAIAGASKAGPMSNLWRLNLSCNYIDYEGVIALVEALKSAKNPRQFQLTGNHYDERGLMYFAEELEKGFLKTPLKEFDLFGSDLSPNISTSTQSAFVRAFKNNKHLTGELFRTRPDAKSQYLQFFNILEDLRRRNEEWARTAESLRNDPQVPAMYGKAFFCGRARVGKTTLRQTLEKTTRSGFRRQLTRLFPRRKNSSLEPTRGIEVSHIHGGRQKGGKFERQLAIWDLAGQREFEVLHSSFVHDIGLADGPGTFFVIVCSENMPMVDAIGNSLITQSKNPEKASTSSFANATNDLLYWLRFIASHSLTTTDAGLEWGQNNLEQGERQQVRKVLVVVNCFHGKKSDQDQKQKWQRHLNLLCREFKGFMDLSAEPLILDVRNIKKVEQLATRLDDEVKVMLEQHKVPSICQSLLERSVKWVEDNGQYPVLQWDEYCCAVGLGSDALLEAATSYLHETGHIVWFKGLQGSEKSFKVGVPAEGNQHASALEHFEGQSSNRKSQVSETKKAVEGVDVDVFVEASSLGEIFEAGPCEGNMRACEHETGSELEFSEGNTHVFEPRPGESSKVWRNNFVGVVVMSPEYFCQRVVGHLLLPDDLLEEGEQSLRAMYKNPSNPSDESLPLATIANEHFDIPTDRCGEMVQILLRLGLGYSHREDPTRVYVPALIEKKGAPGWYIDTCQKLREGTSWTIGFSLKPQHPKCNILPVTILRQLQVELAYDRQIGQAKDSKFRADVSQIWFQWEKMAVLVEYSAPEFVEQDRLDVLVMPLINNSREVLRRVQVDVAHHFVQRVQLLASESCPGLKLGRWIIEPWNCAEGLQCHTLLARDTMLVADVIVRMKNEGVNGGLNWIVGNTQVKFSDVLAEEDFQQAGLSFTMPINDAKAASTNFPENFCGDQEEVDAQAGNASSDIQVRKSRARARADAQTAIVLDAVEKLSGRVEWLSCKLEERQESTNKHMLSLEAFLVQDKMKSVPRFAYVKTLTGKKKIWANIKKGFAQNSSLHFLCEAGFPHGRLHEVEEQPGVKITELKEWIKIIIPLLDWTLKLAFVAAKVANGAVLPGLSILFRDDDSLRSIMNSSSQIANGINDLGKFLYKQFPLDPGPSNATMLSQEEGEACIKQALDLVRQILALYDPLEFQKLIGLRKVKFCGSACRDTNIVAWICNPCFDKYGPKSVLNLGSSCK